MCPLETVTQPFSRSYLYEYSKIADLNKPSVLVTLAMVRWQHFCTFVPSLLYPTSFYIEDCRSFYRGVSSPFLSWFLVSKRQLDFKKILLSFFVCQLAAIEFKWNFSLAVIPKTFPEGINLNKKERKTVLKTENIFFYFILPSFLSPFYFTTL